MLTSFLFFLFFFFWRGAGVLGEGAREILRWCSVGKTMERKGKREGKKEVMMIGEKCKKEDKNRIAIYISHARKKDRA